MADEPTAPAAKVRSAMERYFSHELLAAKEGRHWLTGVMPQAELVQLIKDVQAEYAATKPAPPTPTPAEEPHA